MRKREAKPERPELISVYVVCHGIFKVLLSLLLGWLASASSGCKYFIHFNPVAEVIIWVLYFQLEAYVEQKKSLFSKEQLLGTDNVLKTVFFFSIKLILKP